MLSCILQINSSVVVDFKFLSFLLGNICFAVVILNYRVLTDDDLPYDPPAHTAHLFLLCMTTQPELPFHTQFDCLSRPAIPR